MNAFALLVVTATLGVDYGWHRGNDGEWEYIIQIEPALVDTLSKGQALVSQMPPELRGVRRFRIQIGQGEVPRDQLPAGGILGADGLRPAEGAGAWGAQPYPADPGGLTSRNLDWLRQNPIHLDPLENSFLAGGRGAGSEFGREPLRPPQRYPADPWNRPGTNFGVGTTAGWNSGVALPPQGGFGDSGPAQGTPGGIGPEPLPYESYNRRGSELAWNSPAPRMGLPSPRAGGAWGQAGGIDAPELDGHPGDFALPERPQLEYGRQDPAGDARRFRLNDGNSPAGRGFNTGLPAPPGTRSGRSPSVSLNLPERGRLPGDTYDASADLRRTTGAPDLPATGGKGRGAAHAEITQNGVQRSAAATTANDKIWWPLTTTVLLLFGSLGGNIYLGWLAMDFYRRYRECAWELRTGN